ncbi:NAD-P-binding protein [Daedaleopsis nitida]|nr:NAD-P-binding protein [Daedaleopsis nitida]
MTSYAIIGASRGIGLAYVRLLAARPDATVFAVVRSASTAIHLNAAIHGLKNVHVVEGDVADYRTLEAAASQVSTLSGGTLDCLIHNAARTDSSRAFKGYESFEDMQELDEDFIDAFKVNTLGVIHGIAAFLPLLRASSALLKKIVVISTGGADPKTVLSYGIADMAAYQITKAAALMATTKYALKLKDDRFVVVSLTPGLVDVSDTFGEHGDAAAKARVKAAAEKLLEAGAPIVLQTPEESVGDQLRVIDALRSEDNGLLLAHTGGEWKSSRK